MSWIRLSLFLLLATWSLSETAAQAEATSVDRYFAGLRQRGLYVLAEEYAVRQLSTSYLSPDVRRRLVVELTATLVDHARLNSGPQQAELLSSASDYLQRELRQGQLPPADRFLLQGELALLGAQTGEILTWESQLQPTIDTATIRTRLDQSLGDLQGFLQRIPQSPPELPRDEKNDLENRLRLAIAQTYLDRASLAEKPANRTGDLLSASSELEEATRLRGRDDLAREARLKLAVIARLRQDEALAGNLLESLSGLDAPPDFQDRVRSEQIRGDLAAGRYDRALERLTTTRSTSPELRALGVDVLANAAALAGQRQQLTLQDQLLNQACQELSLVGGHWQRWASRQLQLAQVRQQYGPELAAIVIEGQEAYQQRDLQRAIERFGEASQLALKQQRLDDAMEFGLTQGSIQLQQGQSTEAAATLRQLVESFPSHKRSGEAHLLLCYALGMAYSAAPAEAHAANYVVELEHHRQRYANDSSAADATWMLANFLEQQHQPEKALPLYTAIPAGSKHHNTAQLKVVELDQQILQQLRMQQQPTAAWEDQAILRLGQIVAEYPLSPEPWTLTQAEIGVQGARLLLQHHKPRNDDADALLGRVMESAAVVQQHAIETESKVDPRWQELNRQARQLRILSLAGRGMLVQARDLLQQLETNDPQTLLQLLNGLSELSNSITESGRRQLGQLQQEMATRLQQRRTELPPEQQRLLDEIIAQAQVASGNIPEATAIYEQLLQSTPSDRRLITTVAELYVQRGQDSDLERARLWWAKLEGLEQPGSEAWLAARLKVIRVMIQQQEVDAARKLIGVTRILYPRSGSAEMQQQYAEVARQCERTATSKE